MSNFGEGTVDYGGLIYPTNEHFYQAMKTTERSERLRMSELPSPGQAKREGRKLKIRSDWEQVKDNVMMFGLRSKFSNPKLREKLEATKGRLLIEGNSWHDREWGVCDGTCKTPHPVAEGRNKLGIMLMHQRDGIWPSELTAEETADMFSTR